MMSVISVNTREARQRLRDLLDDALRGVNDTIIERNGKPVAVVIPFEDYQALQDELEDLRASRRAAAVYEAWKNDPSRGRPYSEIRSELIQEGLLDD